MKIIFQNYLNNGNSTGAMEGDNVKFLRKN